MHTQNQTPNVPIPEFEESEERYTIRAHQQLRDAVPDCEKRNELIWRSWDMMRGDGAAKARAKETFTPDRFDCVPEVCYFAEHDTVGADGTPKSYRARDIAEITRTMNSRAARRKSFAAICDNHTPVDPNAPAPDIIGYTGNYRMGMIDDHSPVFAIFADEYRNKKETDRFSKLPRRSVELLTFPDGERRIDPIAALGSRAPRLDLPVKYSANDEGVMVERYCVMCPGSPGAGTHPGSGNTFIPGPTGGKPKKDDYMQPVDATQVAQFMDAIFNTPEMEWVQTQMNTSGATPPESQMGNMSQAAMDPMMGQNAGDPMADFAPMEQPPMPQSQDPLGGQNQRPDEEKMMFDGAQNPAMTGAASGAGVTSPPGNDGQFNSQKFGAEMPNDLDDLLLDTSQYQAADGQISVERYHALENQYNKSVASQKAMQEQLIRQGQLVEQLQRRDEDSRRSLQIGELVDRYGAEFVNASELSQRMLYSNGSQATPQQFDNEMRIRKETLENAHVQVQRYQANNARIPTGAMPTVDRMAVGPNGTIERNSAEFQREVKKVVCDAGNQGKHIGYQEACEIVEGKLRGTPETATNTVQ